MSGAAETVLLSVWLIWLAVWDIRRGELPAVLLAAGGAAGLLLRIIDLAAGTALSALAAAYLPGLAAGQRFYSLRYLCGPRVSRPSGDP